MLSPETGALAHKTEVLLELSGGGGEMLLLAAFLSLVAGLLAGIYPAWRVCSVAPAWFRISAQLRMLEENLGDKLFNRVGRRLELTENGRTVYAYAEEIFSLGRELMGQVGRLGEAVLACRPAAQQTRAVVVGADFRGQFGVVGRRGRRGRRSRRSGCRLLGEGRWQREYQAGGK